MTEPRRIRSYGEVADPGAEDLVEQIAAQRRRLADRLARVQKVIIIASGKGGVGKSALTANLAVALARRGHAVGVADADLYGPSLAEMLDAASVTLEVDDDGVTPVTGADGVRVISTGQLLAPATALGWRGPAGHGSIVQSAIDTSALRELLADVNWGALHFLLIDAPPGTDKLLRLLELVPRIDALLLVATPSAAACRAVRRAATLATKAGVSGVGLIANMTAYRCPDCDAVTPLHAVDGVAMLADQTALDVWADIPFDPRLATATDGGHPLPDDGSPAADAIRQLADRFDAEIGAS